MLVRTQWSIRSGWDCHQTSMFISSTIMSKIVLFLNLDNCLATKTWPIMRWLGQINADKIPSSTGRTNRLVKGGIMLGRKIAMTEKGRIETIIRHLLFQTRTPAPLVRRLIPRKTLLSLLLFHGINGAKTKKEEIMTRQC